jgi:D-galactarolactone cycloisomerase
MKVKKIEPIILYAQDTTQGFSDKQNVGGYTGYQVVVHVETDDGIHGWGECCTGSEFGEAAFAVKVLIEKGLTPRILGSDPAEYRKIWEQLYLAIEWYGRRGLGIFALSGIDTALVDIVGKARGVPAYELLGGRFRSEIPLYASLLFDMDNPEATAKKGLRYVKDGYAGVKFGWGMLPSKPFGADADEDEHIVATVRNTIGPEVWLMVDVGRYVNWTRNYAIQMAKRLQKHNMFWLEEALPQDDVEGYVELTDSVDVTIATGEGYQTVHDFYELLHRKAVDLIQPDVSKAGGLSETKRIVDLARVYNTMWVPHNWSTAINTAASLQIVACSPDAFLLEFKQEPNPLVHQLSKPGFSVRNGKLRIPESPGIGIEVDWDVVEKYRVK